MDASRTLVRGNKLSSAPRRLEGFAALVVVSGELRLACSDGERTRLVEGDAITLAPRATCEVRATASPCEILLLEPDPSFTAAILQLSSGATPAAPLQSASVSRAASPVARRVRQLLRGLAMPLPAGVLGMRRAQAVVELLAVAMEEAATSQPPSAPRQAGAANRSAFLAAVAVIERTEDLEALSLGEFATPLGLSERQVSRLFRIELGTTFCAFMTLLRVDRARRLLEDSALPVIQIAAETGWGSLAHFNSVFRRHTGRTPTAHRSLTARDQ